MRKHHEETMNIEKTRNAVTQSLQSESQDRPLRRYHKPSLVKYGDIRTITLAPTDLEQDESGLGSNRRFIGPVPPPSP